MPRSVQGAIETMPEAGTVAPMRAMQLELPGVKSGSNLGLATGVDPAKQARGGRHRVPGNQPFGGVRQLAQGGVLLGRPYADRAHLERGDTVHLVGPAGRRNAKVIGVIDALGPMGGMEIRVSLDTMRQVYGNYQPAELAVEARNAEQRPALEVKIGALLDRKYPNLEMQSAADAKKEVSERSTAPSTCSTRS